MDGGDVPEDESTEIEKESEKVQESIKECYDVNSEINKFEKRNTGIKIVEIILVICGFVVFFMLKFYLSAFIFVANDSIDPYEAINMSSIISKRTGGDFFGLVRVYAHRANEKTTSRRIYGNPATH